MKTQHQLGVEVKENDWKKSVQTFTNSEYYVAKISGLSTNDDSVRNWEERKNLLILSEI